MNIDAGLKKVCELSAIAQNNRVSGVAFTDIHEILLAIKPEDSRVLNQDVDYAIRKIEQIESRLSSNEERIDDLEKIIRDGEVFDQLNEVIRKLHNRICDLEGYGKKVEPPKEAVHCDRDLCVSQDYTENGGCHNCPAGEQPNPKPKECKHEWNGLINDRVFCSRCGIDKPSSAKPDKSVEETITIRCTHPGDNTVTQFLAKIKRNLHNYNELSRLVNNFEITLSKNAVRQSSPDTISVSRKMVKDWLNDKIGWDVIAPQLRRALGESK